MNLKLYGFVLASSMLLVACKGGNSNQPPVIEWVLGDVKETHPTYYTKKGQSSDFTLSFDVSVKITDPEGHDDVLNIYFTDQYGLNYTIKHIDYNGYWRESDEFYSRSSYHSVFTDSINLTGWTLYVEDSAGNKVQQEFSFPQPNLVTGSGEVFAYTSAYAGVQTNGVHTLVVPELLSTSEIDSVNNFFTFNYRQVDLRATHFDVWLYNETGAYVGNIPSASITNLADINVSSSFTISQDEVIFQDGYSFTDIRGFHWISMDDLTLSQEFVGHDNWWRYRTISELYPFVISP